MAKKRVGYLVVNGKLELPVYNNVVDVTNPQEGMRVYITGEGNKPEGVWRYTSFDEWRPAGSAPRHNTPIIQRDVPNGGSFILAQFNLPTNTQIAVWEAQARNLQGNQQGLRLDVQDTDAGEAIYSLDVANDGTDVKIGNPLAFGGTPGNQVRIRGRNTSAQTKSVTGFVNWSFEQA